MDASGREATVRELLADAARRGAAYLEADAPVFPRPSALAGLAALDHFGDDPVPAADVLARLDAAGSPATVRSTGGRYLGYVIGGALPAATAAHVLATAWDQNGPYWTTSPVVAHLEEVTLARLVSLLGLPAGTGGGFVTGGSMANLSGLAAARRHLLARRGWDVDRDGLAGGPRLRVVVGEETHPTARKALGLLGIGRDNVEVAPTDDQGRLLADALPELDDRTIVCAQAGNVNTGAFDDLVGITRAARDAGAWVHVDGAFGLWAAACPGLRRHTQGLADADSWAVDAHKWLNVPYDCGVVLTRHPEALRGAMSMDAAYLPKTEHREPSDYVPEMSRRARVVDIWAALQHLGRTGLVDLVERNCRQARAYADALRADGHAVLNDVVLNQVLVDFGDPERTDRVIQNLQQEGVVWCGGTEWQGHRAMRISVSAWGTTDDDVTTGIQAIRRAVQAAQAAQAQT